MQPESRNPDLKNEPSVNPNDTMPVEHSFFCNQPGGMPVQNVDTSTITSNLGVVGIIKPKKKWFESKKLFIGVVISVIIVLISGVAGYALTSVYQNPQKVIADSIIKAITSKSSIYTGDFEYKASEYDIKISFSAKQANMTTGSLDVKLKINLQGKDYSIDTKALVDKNGDIYVSVSEVANIVAEFKSATGISDGSALALAVDKVVAKIDGNWIKISKSDMDKYGGEYNKIKECVDGVYEKYSNDKDSIAELTNAYKNNQFIIIKDDLGQKDGSFGYSINGDNVKYNSFVKDIKQTKAFKSLVDCDKNFDSIISTIDANDINTDDSTGSIELWADMWSHQMTKVVLSADKDDVSFLATIKPLFDQDVVIQTPNNSITIDELQSYITDVVNAYYNDVYSGDIYSTRDDASQKLIAI
jgi:hypothetical protein